MTLDPAFPSVELALCGYEIHNPALIRKADSHPPLIYLTLCLILPIQLLMHSFLSLNVLRGGGLILLYSCSLQATHCTGSTVQTSY